ncbi:FHA domain-containing protein [Microbacterium capsulatum]|uniref:FHA domain-containing protein n=1 Tax=Microbacterium capsulatum TaxID=3041921 RepID=A0ABU0XEV3_9MICO|nr:FHA domain-containing protein [Microbacterium sp. ASV81]MDQ4213457.1 FHA domain-containing protein [Microbacterium sp. ASV81]
MVAYSRGDWTAVVGKGVAALFSAELPAASVSAMWSALSADPVPGAVIQVLVGSFGSSLGALPSFAVAFRDEDADEVRLMVRGTARARLTRADGSVEEVGGLGVATWSERSVAGVVAVELAGAGDEPVLYPLADGVAAVGRVHWELSRVRTEIDTSAPHRPVIGETAASEGTRSASTAPDPIPVAAAPAPVEESEDDGRHSEPSALAEPIVIAEPPDPAPSDPDPRDTVPIVRATELDEPAAEASADETLGSVLGQTYVAPLDETFGETSDDETAEDGEEAPDLTTGYDHLLWGETRIQSVEAAAVRPETAPGSVMITGIPRGTSTGAPAAAPAGPAGVQQGDHDGETVSAEHLLGLQGLVAAAVAAPAAVAASAPAVLLVSSGERVVLDRGAVIGRRPRAVRATGLIPHLVTVDSPNQDVSRSHVELRVEGADIVATDLNTTNGTRLLRVGAEPVRLHPGEATLLVGGDRLDLGDDIVLSFEGL